ncbi:MAG: GIY-YIG nuclease family protein [Deinococcota bacterium]|jgi:putative endonuclease|nr:GIY-YIG nuclease family protein [Deinococcota bacterium]
MAWFVYILRCRGGSLYTGITTDPERRVREHNEGGGAHYTRARRPVELVYAEASASRSQACKRELQIKRLSRRDKLELCKRP